MLGEEILYLSVRELQAHLRKRSFTPVELAESYLDRSEKIGPKLNAYVTLTRELALQQARAAETEIARGNFRGPLHGIPYALKDLVAVKGYPTTWGAKPYREQRFDYNATIVEKLNAAGAVLIGKAAMIELAGGLGYSGGSASLTGPCRNPWNTDCWTCGSSSGSGAVVAAGLAAWALGSDTRGSIICPSSWCGVSGMRPSFGRVSRHGAMAIAWTMDKLGPMARTADDCGSVLSVIAGYDPNDHDSIREPGFRYPAPETRDFRPLRIGKITNCWNTIDDQVQRAFEQAAGVMSQAGAHISEAEIPDGPYEEAAELTILIEAASAFEDLISTGNCKDLNDPLGRINGYVSTSFSGSDYLRIQRVRTFLLKRVDDLFESYDVLTTAGQSRVAQPLTPRPNPAQPSPPERQPNRGIERRAPDGVSSLCGLPALAVPCGFNDTGLPMAIQFIGRAGNEHAVLRAANLFQSRTTWHKKHPSLGAM